MSKIWYRFKEEKYPESEPPFYNSKDFPWAVNLEQNWGKVKDEILALVHKSDKEFTSNAYLGLAKPGGWSSLSYIFWGLKTNRGFKQECPVLNGYLEKIPGLISLSFSCLSRETDLGEHYGLTNAMLRCHYGVEIPAGLPECGLKVNGEQRGWEEGKWILFIDAYHHSAWNHTDKRRIVMIIDVIRPEFLHLKNRICILIRARHTQLKIQKKYPVIDKFPGFLKELIFIGIYTIIFVLNPVHTLLDK